MPDMFSKSKRSEIMSKIRSKNTSLEKHTKTLLRSSKIKYKSHPKIYGNPDFLLRKNTVLFCDSSFWHGRNWNKLKTQLKKGNDPQYWVNHIAKNRKRDKVVTHKLKNDGFIVIRFWDDDVYKRPAWCVSEIKKYL